jgi:hypothetical protein
MGALPTSFQIGSKVTAASAAAKYTQRASAAGQYWAAGYLTSKVDPFAAASDAADTCVANFNAAGASAIRAGLARVNKANVAKLVSTVGPTLYNQGIQNKGSVNYASSASGLIPALQQAAANLPPRGNEQQNEQRAVAMMRAAKALRGQFRSK